MTLLNIKMGADPEVFVVNNQKKPRSAHGLVPGSKEHPFPVPLGAVQVDGMALEFNIDAAETQAAFCGNIDTVMEAMKQMLPNDRTIKVQPVAFFSKQHMDMQPIEALELGCDPDFNGYTREENPRPLALKNMRTAAGHVHIGWGEGFDIKDPAHYLACCTLARQLDSYLFIPSLLFDRDKRRQRMYGKPGCFRPKSYGMEYRTLSNWWIEKPEYQRMVYNGAHWAVTALIEDGVERVEVGLGYLKSLRDDIIKYPENFSDYELFEYLVDVGVIDYDWDDQETEEKVILRIMGKEN